MISLCWLKKIFNAKILRLNEKNYKFILSALLVAGIVYGVFFALMPQSVPDDEVPLAEFSTKRALQQVESLAKEPHFVGSENHKSVGSYLEKNCKNWGWKLQSKKDFR